MDNNDSQLRMQARIRLIARFIFYIHVVVYILVNAGLLAINLLTSPGNLWFYWPLLGWGIGLFIHGLVTFAIGMLTFRDMEEKELQKLKSQQER